MVGSVHLVFGSVINVHIVLEDLVKSLSAWAPRNDHLGADSELYLQIVLELHILLFFFRKPILTLGSHYGLKFTSVIICNRYQKRPVAREY